MMIAIAGCEWNSRSSPDANTRADARRATDAGDDATDDALTGEGHLLLTEVALAGVEFIEIANPTAQDVDLSDHYVSDSGNYFALPGGAPVIANADFIIQFPAASSVPAGGVITIAIGTAALFTTVFGTPPTYSIAVVDASVTRTIVTGTPSLTNGGEIVVLFQWDGASDLVTDVDMMIVGAPTVANGLVSKSGLMQGSSSYAADGNTIAAQAAAPGTGASTKRIAAEAGNETQDAMGNGIAGHDETSEDTSVTWDATFTAPTPGTVPAGL